MAKLVACALLFLALPAGAQELVSIRKEAEAFFRREGIHPNRFTRAVATWRVPDLGTMPFVSAGRMQGWLLAKDRIFTGLYELRAVRNAGDFHPSEPVSRQTDLFFELAVWVAALQREDETAAIGAWHAWAKARDPMRWSYDALRGSWQLAWDHYRRPELAVAALEATESVAPDEASARRAAKLREGVLTRPKQIPAEPDPDAPPAEQARVLVKRLRDVGGQAGAYASWGCSAFLLFRKDTDAKRLYDLGPTAYPALVDTLDRPALTSAVEARDTMSLPEPLTYGEVAARILRRRLGFIDKPAVMRAWIASGTWKSDVGTARFFLLHASEPRTRKICIRRLDADDPALRAAFRDGDPGVVLAAAAQAHDEAALLRGVETLGQLQGHPGDRRAAVDLIRACAKAGRLDLLLPLAGKLDDPALLNPILKSIGRLGSKDQIPLLSLRLSERGVKEAAARAIARITGQDFGFSDAKTHAEIAEAIRKTTVWAWSHGYPVKQQGMLYPPFGK